MPVWHARTREAVSSGRLVLLGVIQEQHAERCRLFAQWQGFDWPILHDAADLLELTAVPVTTAIDEFGIVRGVGLSPERFEAEFLSKSFADDAPPAPPPLTARANPAQLAETARRSGAARDWRSLGDQLITWGGPTHIDECVDAYSKAVEIDPKDGSARFRLGVALRMRFDSDHRRADDFQAAAESWTSSLSLDPNHYIRRRRIEQYGPRLTKPYPFYDWVDQARREVAARGERPIELAVEPYGSEIAAPSRALAKSRPLEIDRDPEGKIARDRDELVTIEVAVVPARIRPGGAARVHLILRPNRSKGAHWNNESTPIRLFIDPAGCVDVSATTLEAPQPNIAESDEERRFDFEVQLAADASGTIDLPAHVLFNACESTGGRCLYLRKDLRIRLVVE